MGSSSERDGCYDSLMLGCRYGEEMHIFKVHKESTLSGLYSQLSRRWSEIDEPSTIVKYLVPGTQLHVTLCSDEDVTTMCEVHANFKSRMCDMIARQRDPPTCRNGPRLDDGLVAKSNEYATKLIDESTVDAHARGIRGQGQMFTDAKEFRKTLKNYCIAIRRSFRFKKNTDKRIIVACSEETCKWRIHASYHDGDASFGIRKCDLTHTCGVDNLKTRGHPKADSSWVKAVVKDKLMRDPLYKPCDAVDDIRAKYGVDVNYHVVWYGKEKAMNEIYGDDEKCFDKLRWYCEALKQTNPGSMADLEIKPITNQFLRVFICLGASIYGFVRGCRPIVFLDGTHITSKWKGHLLGATSKDADNGMFTIAYAIVDAETNENWEWFCLKLRDAIKSVAGPISFEEFTFFSDRHRGLTRAVPLIFDRSHHAYCLRHLGDNFKKEVMKKSYPKKNNDFWVGVLKKAAYAPTLSEYNGHMHDIFESMPLAEDYLINSDPSCWANALFPGNRWGETTTNLAESWNSWVLKARNLPPVAMLDTIRLSCMTMMNKRREKAQGMISALCPVPNEVVRQNYESSRTFAPKRSCPLMYEVMDGDSSVTVDLKQHTCTCRMWQLLRIPCPHACACIETMGHSPYHYCDARYTVAAYKKTYEAIIRPIPTFGVESNGDDGDQFVRPPDVKTQPGRPKRKRYPSQESTSKNTCGLCQRSGHNRRTCKESRSQL